MVNMSTLSGIIITCYGCISVLLWVFSNSDEGTKNIDRRAYFVAANIENTYSKNIGISNICTMSTWIRCVNIGDVCIRYIGAKDTFVRDVEPKQFAE